MKNNEWYEKVNSDLLFTFSHNTRTKGHSIKWKSRKFQTNKGRCIYTTQETYCTSAIETIHLVELKRKQLNIER